ncbi:MAG: Cof-type HAD-IIB family hydrolase [Oscillospiraceae bacterium]|nr:Cof-type HAD-IIB family hydrolase [Oscillospiraceae bacterium]
MYRFVAVDIDGTLLNNSSQVSKRNEQAIKDVINAGIIFSLSTGRPLQGVSAFVDMVGADMPFIIYNGAMVVTSKSKQVLHETTLSGELASGVVRLGQQRGTNVFVYRDGKMHVTEISQPVEHYISYFKISPFVVEDLVELASRGVTKVLFRDTPDRITDLQNEAAILFKDKLNYFTSQPNLLEFVDSATSKGAAMRVIGERYGIPQCEMMAIGDSYNDIEMIRHAALGVAMGNAPQEIKDIADAVTSTNEEDGVAEAIYRYVLDRPPSTNSDASSG